MTTPTTDADAQAADELVEEIIALFSPLAIGLARRYATARDWLSDDLRSEAMLALWKTARAHVAKAAPEETPYADIKRAVGLAVTRRLVRRIDHERGMRRVESQHARDRAASRRCAPDHADQIADRDQHEHDFALAMRLLNSLPEDRAEVVLQAVCEGRPMTDLARAHGVKLPAMSARVWRAVRQMRSTGGIRPERDDAQLKTLTGVSETTRTRLGEAAKARQASTPAA